MNTEILQSLLIVAAIIAATAGLYWVCNRFMRPFHNRAFFCLLALLVGGYVTSMAVIRYLRGEGGFKLGVELVGGTTLEYEVDIPRLRETKGEQEVANLNPSTMVAFLKRRIDPNDLYNVTIRSVRDKYHYEIVLPTGSAYQANLKQDAWTSMLNAVRENPAWKDALANVDLDVKLNRDRDLVYRVRQAVDKKSWAAAIAEFKDKFKDQLKDKPDIKLDANSIEPGSVIPIVEAVKAANIGADEVKKFLETAYKPLSEDVVKEFIKKNFAFGTGGKRDFSKEMIEEAKELIKQQGSLEFRIAASPNDDKAGVNDKLGIEAAEAFLKDPKNAALLATRANEGLPPPARESDQKPDASGFTYSWVELGKAERKSLGLTQASWQRANEMAESAKQEIIKQFEAGQLPSEMLHLNLPLILAKYRAEGKPVTVTFPVKDDRKGRSGTAAMVFYSRPSAQKDLGADEKAKKQFDYFILLRDPVKGAAITGENLRADVNDANQSVDFHFDASTARLFGRLTEANQPNPYNEGSSHYFRYLAIILDGKVVSAPYLSAVITDQGQIEMKNSPREDRARLVKMLRAGALPAPLKPEPASENPIDPTLGRDNIYKGLLSVGLAFAAVMIFMMIYYEFAGVVACIALIANLLLTVAFMVFVDATFTLPGLAGLVLMLGMAVDANVLIYERIREERDRGASLSLAIRNGYDRAFPTIIDTHLTSFFTAVVLYAVGNDQLRGFGISLASGLVISLFTSLYMTRLIFDVWQYKGWLKQLNMRRFFTKTNIDFMGIRHYLFAFTLFLTVAGLAVFLLRGTDGLNIDFVGGVEYTGELKQNVPIEELRDQLKNQEKRLAVAKVDQVDQAGKTFRITYQNFADKQPTIRFDNVVIGPEATKEAREEVVKNRAMQLPAASLHTDSRTTDADSKAGETRRFKVTTTEGNEDLVRTSINRLLAVENNGKLDDSRLKTVTFDKYDVKGRTVTLEFNDYASPGFAKRFLESQFEAQGLGDQTFELKGEGKSVDEKYKTMTLQLTSPNFDPQADRAKLDAVFSQTKADFADLPQSPRKVGSQLAEGSRTTAFVAIFASWVVILLFLWFRCGSWTFGMAAVLCLVHDLCFTLGAIAFCHYFVEWFPTVSHLLLLDDFKIDLPAVAALLTLVGYSVNDTIVVFDRIREVRGKNPELTFKIINDSVNQTLSRTLLASATVFIVVGVLYLFGGESIRLFAFVMVMGVIVGTYSSIYVASPLLIMLGEGQSKGRAVPKPVETGANRP